MQVTHMSHVGNFTFYRSHIKKVKISEKKKITSLAGVIQ